MTTSHPNAILWLESNQLKKTHTQPKLNAIAPRHERHNGHQKPTPLPLNRPPILLGWPRWPSHPGVSCANSYSTETAHEDLLAGRGAGAG